MDQSELLGYLLDVLERLELPYAIGGSHATMAYGETRFTNDIDVVIGLTPATFGALSQAFPFPDFYISEDGANIAVRKGGMFNIIHPASGLKIDVIVPKDDFERQELPRAVRVPAFTGRSAAFVSPEDVIIKKMQAYEEGGSEKHLRDITGVLKILGNRVDREYISDWSNRLKYDDIWQAILKRLDGVSAPKT